MKREKIGIIILLLVLIAIIIVIVVVRGKGEENVAKEQNEVVNEEKYVTELEDETKINTSKEFNNTKRYGELEISNMNFTERKGQSVMLADVTNTGKVRHEVEIVKITILGEQGEVITEVNAVIGKIEPGETEQINATIYGDVVNAKDYTIEAEE